MFPYVAVSALASMLGFTLIGLLAMFIHLQVHGTGPHGYGVFGYFLIPMAWGPAGLLAGLIGALARSTRSWASVLVVLGWGHLGCLAVTAALLLVVEWIVRHN